MNKEIWKDIEGYEGKYQVSNLGRVKSLGNRTTHKAEIMLSQNESKKGYMYVSLCKDGKGKSMTVHRLVAFAFVPKEEQQTEVNHINGVKNDNRATNLEWVSPSQNIRHAYRTKLIRSSLYSITDEQVEFMRTHFNPRDKNLCIKGLAKRFNVSYDLIYAIITNKVRTDHTYKFRGSRRFSKSEVAEIRSIYKAKDPEFGAVPLSKKYGVLPKVIENIAHNRTYKSNKSKNGL